MKLINEQENFESWAPIIAEKTNIQDANKIEWLSKYCHYHSLNESYNGFQTLGDMGSLQGSPLAPSRTSNGSGDKFPSLLPLAIQVAAATIGFDIVPVIPMQGPVGVLTYLDYVYTGGNINNVGSKPEAIKVKVSSTTLVEGTAYTIGTVGATYIGKSRIDGYAIFQITTVGGSSIAAEMVPNAPILLGATNEGTLASDAVPSLVPALENHISGFTGAGATDTDAWSANTVSGSPMNREVGESTYYRSMGLKTFTKQVEAKSYQAAAEVTTEQIQDLQKQFGIDVVSLVENALTNELSQSINKHILGTAFALGTKNAVAFAATEGQSLTLDLTANATAGTFENLGTYQRRIFSRILAAGNVVANRGRRGPASFVVCGPQIATAIQDISQFVAAPFDNKVSQNNGSLYPVGQLAGMTVYVDQNMKWNDTKVLVGRKGGDNEPGIKFMPYMMAESIHTIAEGTMSPKIAVKSRYALVEAGHHPETVYFTFSITLPANGIV
jgi:hypothetical protein